MNDDPRIKPQDLDAAEAMARSLPPSGPACATILSLVAEARLARAWLRWDVKLDGVNCQEATREAREAYRAFLTILAATWVEP